MNANIVVVGGGSAGVAAAVGAARAGASVTLVESGPCLGGASTLRGVASYCGLYTISDRPRPVAGGVAADIVTRLRKLGAAHGPIRFRGTFLLLDPEAVKVVLDDICADADVNVLLHATVVGADRDGDRVEAVRYRDHAGEHVLTADAFVDASGEGDLAYAADASTRYGNHGTVNLGTLATRFGGIAPSVQLDPDRWTEAIRAARERGVSPLSKDASMLARLPLSNDVIAYLASAPYDARDAVSISAAEREGRRQAWTYLEVVRTMPGFEDAYLASTGPSFGTRESRHVDGRYQLTEQDVLQGARFHDSIGLGSWGTEWHSSDTYSSSFDAPGGTGAYEIPLRSLHSVDTDNLFAAGRLADADQKAGASLRVMGTALITGHAAGVAAALAASSIDHEAHTSAVRAELRRQGALLDATRLPPPCAIPSS